MSLFQRHRGFLQSLLREANAKRRNVMLDLANKNQLNALCEMILIVMKRNLPIQPKTIQKLKRYKNFLQKLRLRQTSLNRKREQLKQQRARILAGFKRMLRSMLCLGRDEYGYPPEGIDLVPEQPKPREPLDESITLLEKGTNRSHN